MPPFATVNPGWCLPLSTLAELAEIASVMMQSLDCTVWNPDRPIPETVIPGLVRPLIRIASADALAGPSLQRARCGQTSPSFLCLAGGVTHQA
jgi:hypothetical protein